LPLQAVDFVSYSPNAFNVIELYNICVRLLKNKDSNRTVLQAFLNDLEEKLTMSGSKGWWKLPNDERCQAHIDCVNKYLTGDVSND
jgi:hypothetical protein